MSKEAVKVVVRCRPLNGKEKADGRDVVVDMDVREGSVRLRNPKGMEGETTKAFTFDQVYDWNSNQREIFAITARPLIDDVMEGYNGTIFAYGQTGTGKSHTMEGKDEPPELRGIIPSSFNYVFEQIGRQSGEREFLVRASYLEIYNEEIRDLLARNPENKLELKETPDRGVYVKDLMQFVVKGVAELNSVLQAGKKNRMVGATAMNADSSRSHSIFTICVETIDNAATAAAAGSNRDQHIRVGKLNLVDLAGSERQSKTGATGDRLKEGIKINLSLTALGNVISALVDGKGGHIPYRDSKLTRLLQDSLGGNTKTVMVANIGPADWNFDETLSTLRYANRAKNITNKPKINEDPKDAMMRGFQEEISRLKEELAQRQGGPAARVVERVVEVEADGQLLEQLRDKMRSEIEAKIRSDMSAEAAAKARAEAEAHARAQLEAAMAGSSHSEEQRRALREALEHMDGEMEAIAAGVEADRRAQEELMAKIAAMESKVLHGNVNLLDKVDELKQRSAATKQELEVQRRLEEEQKRRLKELALQNMDSNQKYSSLEEEVAEKGRQLVTLYERYKSKKAEVGDLQQQFQAEREDLLEDYRQLTQTIKLKNLVIACFIPPAYQDTIMSHCHWHEYEEKWQIDFMQHAGNAQRARQDAEQASAAVQDQGPHFLQQTDAARLQRVYLTYPDEGPSGSSNSSGATTKRGTGGTARPGSSCGSERAGGSNSSSPVRPSSRQRHAGNASPILGSGGGTGGALGSGASVRASSSLRRRDGADVGSLRDSAQWAAGLAEKGAGGGSSADFPSARGLVKNAAEGRLMRGSRY